MAHSQIVLLLLATSIADTLAQDGGFGGGQGGFGGGPGGFGGGPGGFGGGQGGFGGGQEGFGGGQGGFGGGQGGFGGGPGGFGGDQGGFGSGQGGFGGGPGGFGGGLGGFGGGPFGQGGPGGLGGPFGGFGGPGGFPGGFPGFPGMFPNFGQYSLQQPQFLTCIGTNDALDQLKITFSPEPYTNSQSQQMDQRMEFQSKSWRISAFYIPAASAGRQNPPGTASLNGQFYMAITRNGRTDGSCSGLGGILQHEDTINGGSDAFQNSPYLQAMRNQQFSQPAGHIADQIITGYGGNVFTGVVRDLTEIDMRGRGVALCLDALCQKPLTTCCTIAKDSVAAAAQLGPSVGTTGGHSSVAGAGSFGGVGGLLSGGSSSAGAGLASASASSSGLF